MADPITALRLALLLFILQHFGTLFTLFIVASILLLTIACALLGIAMFPHITVQQYQVRWLKTVYTFQAFLVLLLTTVLGSVLRYPGLVWCLIILMTLCFFISIKMVDRIHVLVRNS